MITILTASMTGTADMVAEDVKAALEAAGQAATIAPMDALDPAVFAPGVYLICTSTYGQGDVPDNGQALYTALESQRPDLSAVRYGVIGLGDSTYVDTFNHGGKRFDDLLSALGARRLGARLEHDAGGAVTAEVAAVAWLKDWLGEVAAVA
jgi:MioC protein